MKRRDFLSSAAIGTGALVSGRIPDAFAQEIKTKPKRTFSTDPVALVPLTDKITCSRLGFGCGMRGSNRESNITRMEKSKALEILRYAYDKGIRFFDMADLYGAHGVVTEAMEGKPRDSYTLSSKIWVHGGGIPEKERPDADIVVKRFLKECKTDYLDIVQLHCMMNDKWAEQFGKQLEILDKLKKEGLIRAHGVSCHSPNSIELAAKTPWTDVIHARINSEGVNMEGPSNGQEKVDYNVKLMTDAHNAGIGVIAMKVLGEGKFGDSLEQRRKSVKFVADLECVDVMIAAFDEKEYVTEFVENVELALKELAPKA